MCICMYMNSWRRYKAERASQSLKFLTNSLAKDLEMHLPTSGNCNTVKAGRAALLSQWTHG